MLDVESEKLSPVLTTPDCKEGTKYKRFGNSMFFSRKKDIIYYSAPGWQKAIQYNMATKEEKVIATIKDGFWFEGFLDDKETMLYAINRFGQFRYNINSKVSEKFAEKNDPFYIDTSHDGKFNFYQSQSNNGKNTLIKVVPINKPSAAREINLSKLIPESRINIIESHPSKNQLLLDVNLNSGTEIYKLTQLFE